MDNPTFGQQYNGRMESMAQLTSLFGERYSVAPASRATERGELLKKFSVKTGKPLGFIAYRLTGIPTRDLYFIEKQCDTYQGPWSKAFFGMLKTR